MQDKREHAAGPEGEQRVGSDGVFWATNPVRSRDEPSIVRKFRMAYPSRARMAQVQQQGL